MALTLSLLIKLLPLYLNILLGYIAGRKLDVNGDSIARLMFYMINPLLIFHGVATTKMDGAILSLPIITFAIASIICLVFYQFSSRLWEGPSKNLVAFSAGSGMTGYFGLPLAIMLLDEQSEGIYIMTILGVTLYENSLGYYISAKGSYTTAECMKKIIKLPTTYAFLVGLAITLFSVELPDIYTEFINGIKGVYVVLGMMIVGLGMASVTNFKVDFKFIGLTFAAKFFVWPLIVLGVILIDTAFFGFYDPNVHQALIVLSIVPMAVNTIVLASVMKYQADAAASTVMLSMVFALFYVPVMAFFLIK